MQGILLVDKPKGWTSFDVVNYIRRLVATDLGVKPSTIKVGHIGTLDPLATGLLVLLIGKQYTKRAVDLAKLDKVYEVELMLGKVSDSFDAETEIRPFSDYQPTLDEVNQAIESFTGIISQTPPQFSAIKVKGQRAYQLARSGRVAKLTPRKVHIYDISSLSYKYPSLKFTASVSSGTYIRSLVNDLGLSLKSGAYMSSLRRLSIAEFSLSGSLAVERFTPQLIELRLRSE